MRPFFCPTQKFQQQKDSTMIFYDILENKTKKRFCLGKKNWKNKLHCLFVLRMDWLREEDGEAASDNPREELRDDDGDETCDTLDILLDVRRDTLRDTIRDVLRDVLCLRVSWESYLGFLVQELSCLK